MSYRYYKIGLSQKEFNHGFDLFVKNNNEFLKILDKKSEQMKIEIYKKNDRISFSNGKNFNYTIVEVEAREVNKESISLVFSDYLNNINIKPTHFMSSFLYLRYVIFKTDKMNDDLIDFIKGAFNSDKKGKYIRYVTIPIVYDNSKDLLYIGCYSGNKLDSNWFKSDMIIWILENFQEKGIDFNKISLVKSEESENDIHSLSDYENIYNKNMMLCYDKEKKLKYLFIFLIIILFFRFIHNPILLIFLCLLLFVIISSFVKEYKINLCKINKIRLIINNNYDFIEKINDILKNYYSSYIDSFIFVDKYSIIDFEKKFNNDKKYYLILLDDYLEKEILNIISTKSAKIKKNILVLKLKDNKYLQFVKDDNLLMKNKFLNIIKRLL